MASFNKAYQITASWEGNWGSSKEDCKASDLKNDDCEEYAYGVKWGTNFGLTGKFMKEFVGWTANRKTEFQRMNAQQCAEIWKNTRWVWMQGDLINDQEIANLIFDWCVHRFNLTTVKAIADILGVNYLSITRVIKNRDIGGNPKGKNDGFHVFTPAMAMLINKRPNQRDLFNRLYVARQKYDTISTASYKQRVLSFTYNGTQPKSGGVLAYNNLTIPKTNTPSVEKQSGGSFGLVGWVALGFLGYKILGK